MTDTDTTEYRFDKFSGQVLIGNEALESHIEAGGHPADILPLGEFLSNLDLEVPLLLSPQNINGWSRQECLDAGQWLLSILPEPSRPKEKILSEKILRRAGMIGILPGYRQISAPSRFGSFSNYYKELGLYNAHRTFREWSDNDLVDFVGKTVEELGRLPTVQEVRSMSKKHPSLPSYETIYKRLGGIIPAAEKAGMQVPRNWSIHKFIN